MWSKQIIDFGQGKPNETKYESIQYLGNQEISSSNFMVSCGCTTPIYDPQTKVLAVGLHLGPNDGVKSANIQVNYPDGSQEVIRLTAIIIK
jgi:hypothetical protein